MLFYQSAWLLACVYAHVVSSRLGRSAQGKVHLGVVGLATAILPLLSFDIGAPPPGVSPIGAVLTILLARVGLPVFVMGATTALLQRWLSGSSAFPSPYWLYAYSNAGSLLGLLSFPLWFERVFTRRAQLKVWSLSFVVYVVLLLICMRISRSNWPDPNPRRSGIQGIRVSLRSNPVILWLLLSACGSTLLLAITNAVCENLAVFPLLWIGPLSLYLLSLIICFHAQRLYRRPCFFLAFAICSVALIVVGHVLRGESPGMTIAGSLLLLFCSCMLCHGELAALKPAPADLTSFYLTCGAGGVLGGLFVGLLAPALFSDYWELPLAVQGCGLLVLGVVLREDGWRIVTRRAAPRVGGLILMGLILVLLVLDKRAPGATPSIRSVRNFYGVLSVAEEDGKRKLYHGRVEHGFQYIDPARERQAGAYFGQDSGVAIAISHH